MFVETIKYGTTDHQQIAQKPSWDFVQTALRSLDGNITDGVALESAGKSYMGIAGGERGHYVIAGYLQGFGSFICASGDAAGPAKDVVVAGDFNTYASENVVGIETAVLAAKAFYERGALLENLKWENRRKDVKR
ncbi:MAG: hypothetical protein ABSH22_11150 [Tepidisphaeraceae bacterium]|jgi:hypothetical protein